MTRSSKTWALKDITASKASSCWSTWTIASYISLVMKNKTCLANPRRMIWAPELTQSLHKMRPRLLRRIRTRPERRLSLIASIRMQQVQQRRLRQEQAVLRSLTPNCLMSWLGRLLMSLRESPRCGALRLTATWKKLMKTSQGCCFSCIRTQTLSCVRGYPNLKTTSWTVLLLLCNVTCSSSKIEAQKNKRSITIGIRK